MAIEDRQFRVENKFAYCKPTERAAFVSLRRPKSEGGACLLPIAFQGNNSGFYDNSALRSFEKMFQKPLTKEAALQKLRHYCGYQERSHSDVKQKIFSLGVAKADREELLATLIEEGYLNELRFAIAFAGGKFRINGWGKIKIRNELRQRQVSEYCIKQALKEIDESDYRKTLAKLLEAKWNSVRNDKSLPARARKVMDYLLLKGFEREMILPLLKNRQ